MNRTLGQLKLGKIWLFACVGHSRLGRSETAGQELFVEVKPYDDTGVISRDYTGGYTFARSATEQINNTVWIHVSQLCTHLFAPKGSDKTTRYNETKIKFVSIAKAFVED
jgi:hypothetical protein